MKDVASEVKTLTAIKPQVASGEATAINGVTIDRKGCNSGVFSVAVGDSTGTPTRFGITFKVQSKSGEESWADASGQTKTFSGETSVTSNQQYMLPSDFRALGRYVRLAATPTFTAGTNPNIQIAAVVVVGEASVAPIA